MKEGKRTIDDVDVFLEMIERLRHQTTWVTTTRSAILSAPSEGKVRYVTQIEAFGDGQAARVLAIGHNIDFASGSSYVDVWPYVHVAQTGNVQLNPVGSDIRRPLTVLEGGTSLEASVNGNSVAVTVSFIEYP